MKKRICLAVSVALLFLAGCNLPKAPSQESGVPPLDLTITALYKTALAQPATNTPAPQVATATSTQAAATQAPSASSAPSSTPAPTNTPPPTNTSQPSATSIPQRGGVAVEAVHWTGSGPTIDGDWSEWKSVAREYPAKSVVFGAKNWSGEDDLAASFYVGWDDTYLYIAAKVRDDKYVQIAQGENIFKGDSLEVLLDTDLLGDFGSHNLSGDDYQLGISPGRPTIADGNAEAYLWFPSGKKGAPSGVKIAAVDEGSQYRVEAAIPWKIYGITPKKGLRMGFAFSASDDDTAGKAVQESMVSNVPTRNLADPTSWGEIILK